MTEITEDAWHSLAGRKAAEFVAQHIDAAPLTKGRLLNAGCGQYEIRIEGWEPVCLDLFETPLRGRDCAVCGNIEAIPFAPDTFQAVVCVGEVLGYCDPARAISEFARVLSHDGVLIIDFTSSASVRRWGTVSFGRAAELITDQYNGTPERTWIYAPDYIKGILSTFDLRVISEASAHNWSALVRRIGLSSRSAAAVERFADRLPFPGKWADLKMIAAVQRKIAG